MLSQKRVGKKNTGLGIRKHKIRCSLILIRLVIALYLGQDIKLLSHSFNNPFISSPIHWLCSNKQLSNVSCVLGTVLGTEVKIKIIEISFKKFIDQLGR